MTSLFFLMVILNINYEGPYKRYYEVNIHYNPNLLLKVTFAIRFGDIQTKQDQAMYFSTEEMENISY